MEENEEIKEATVEVRKMSEDEKMQRLADLREKAIMDEKAIYVGGLEKGIKQGIEQKTIEMVKNLNKINMPIEQIAQVANIKIDKVKEILKLRN